MKTHIVFYSGGKSSFSVADYVKTTFGDKKDHQILLLFTDTFFEHNDTYRFLNEGADKLQLPMLTLSKGITPIQLMFEEKLVFNSLLGLCSKKLKSEVAADYLLKGIKPKIVKWRNKHFLKDEEMITNDCILYFGIDFMEIHRVKGIQKNWPLEVRFPLIDQVIDNDELLRKYSISTPELYLLGFSHNNCGARCCKAGMGHYANLHEQLPEVYKELLIQEHYLSLYVEEYHYIKNMSEEEYSGFDDDVKKHWLNQLDECYRPYFYGETPRPKIWGTVNPFSRNFRNYSFMKKDGKALPLKRFNPNNVIQRGKSKSKQVSLFDLEIFDQAGCGCFVD
jgi:hypothetical protein